MASAQDYVFILWRDRFDEAATAIFVSEFRKAGLQVRLVGLGRSAARGAHGLAILSDLTLHESLPLASQAICIVIPCDSPSLRRLLNDPRLVNFIQQAGDRGALFIVGPAASDLLRNVAPTTTSHLLYPTSRDMVPFAQQMAAKLSAERSRQEDDFGPSACHATSLLGVNL